MPTVTFHFNVADPIDYVCRLVRKVRARQMTLVVCAEPSDLANMDQRLWMLETDPFLAHATGDAPEEVRSRSPVVLCSDLVGSCVRQVLVNMRTSMPATHDVFERVVEVVPPDESARALARQRWRSYQALGLTPDYHDAAAASKP